MMGTAEDDELDSPVVGTCRTMCPISEIELRHENRLLHVMEIMEESRKKPMAKWEPDILKMVKEYRRPAAGKLELEPEVLRPADVLLRTSHYLMLCAASKTSDLPWTTIYGFVFDRMRAIRQDLVVQRISGLNAIQILEMAIRFHVYAGYRLCEEQDMSKYDDHINKTHCVECMKRLMVLYDTCESPEAHSNRLFFSALYLLYNLGSEEALFYCLKRIDLFRDSAEMKRALAISFSYARKNYVRFLRLMKSSSPLIQCALHRHLNKIYLDSMTVMVSGHNSKNLHYDIGDLTSVLKLNSRNETERLCQHFCLSYSEKGVNFNKSVFVLPENMYAFHRHLQWIDNHLDVKLISNFEERQVESEWTDHDATEKNADVSSGTMKGLFSNDSVPLKPRSRGRGRGGAELKLVPRGRGRGCAILK